MKTIFIAVTVLLTTICTYAQNNKAFEKLQDVNGIQYFAINKTMINAMSLMQACIDGEKTSKYIDKIKDVDNLKAFVSNKKRKTRKIRRAMKSYLKDNNLEQFFSINNDKANIQVYVNKGGSAALVKEFLVFVEGGKSHSSALLSFTGNINLDDLKDIN